MPKLSSRRRQELKTLAAQPDSEIDFSDIPEINELPPEYFVGLFYRPKKKTITIRLDADLVAWLKAQGKGYQTRVNFYLRALMCSRRKADQASPKRLHRRPGASTRTKIVKQRPRGQARASDF